MNSILDQQDKSFSKELSREFFRSVYSFMFGALIISGILAYYCGTPSFFFKYFVTPTGLSPLYYVVLFAPMGLAMLIQMAYQKLSYGLLLILFIAFSVIMGISLSTIFIVYALPQIASTFFVTAGAFAGMAILGYTTKTDLTKMGSLLYMAFIGIFIAGIMNIFIESDLLSFVVAVIGVFVFTGLTAYYMQKLKDLSQELNMSEISRQKLALVGGLILYITFINLFLSLLRLLGGNRD